MTRKKSFSYADELISKLEKEESLKGKKPEGDRLAAITRIKGKMKLLKESSAWGPLCSLEQKSKINSRYFQSGLETREETEARLAKDRERKRAKTLINRISKMSRDEKYLRMQAEKASAISSISELLATQVVTKPKESTPNEFLDDLMERFNKVSKSK